MAYSLSGDPRKPLDEPWETYREEFDKWYEKIEKNNLLMEIKSIGSNKNNNTVRR